MTVEFAERGEVEDTALADRIEPLPIAAAAPTQLFGHPRGLTFLFTTEMWERFSYYGMRSLLVLYMTKFLLLSDHSGDVIGLAALKRALEGLFGPLEVQPLSSQIWGLYTGLVYFTPIFGGLLADRVLGQRRTVVVGATLMAIGHFMMAVEQLFLFALLALILGSGCFKPNISTQVGGLYAPGDPRRDRAYSIFYVGINLGAFLAPLVCGTLGERAGWHYGFAAAGVGMVIGLCIYLYAQPMLPQDEMHKTELHKAKEEGRNLVIASAAKQSRRSARTGLLRRFAPRNDDNSVLKPSERRAIVALLVLLVPNTLFWATYEQMGNTIILWADANTDRSIDALHLFGVSAQIPTTWFLAFNPFMIFAFTPFVVALWARQAARGTEPATISKMALGCFGVCAANLIMVAAALWSDASGATGNAGKASWLWLFAYFVVITLGELYLSPVGLSFVTKVAPARLISLLMGVWLSASFTGGFLAGYIGSFWSRMAKPEFFLLVAGIAAVAGVTIWGWRWAIKFHD
jgi:POT family proton-dependent oligopeptide transporter